ncbi:MAG: GntR family transcriptional regulator [Alphaproteobacteria bacterium]
MNEVRTKASPLPVAPLLRDTLQERVYRQLSDLILDGEIVPGQSVKIQALAEAFGVSAMPVREALKRLTAAKALTVVSGRSIGIPLLTIDRLIDLRRVRTEIESIAAEWAAPNINEAGIKALADQLTRMESATASGDVKGYLRANRAFHFIVYAAAGSDTLLSIIESLWLQISPYFNLLHGSENYSASNEQHQAMLNAIRAGDKSALVAAVRADIDGAYDLLTTLLA